MKFFYWGYDNTAKKTQGEIEAANISEARLMLKARSIWITKLQSPADLNAASGIALFIKEFIASPKPNTADFTAFIRQLATMQGAGVPIVQALNVLSDQAANKSFGSVLANIQKAIETGTTFTDALRKYPKVFDRIFINLVSAGEVSGALEKVLQRLAVFYEKAAALRRKVLSAFTYPVMVIVLVVGVVSVLLTFVVPTFAKMFASSGKPLPAPTQMIMDASSFVRGNWYFIFGGLGALVYGIIFAFKSPEVRKVIDPYLMKVPIFGTLFQKISIARFSRTLATMIQSGVPILDALEICSSVAGNYAVEDAILMTRKSITEGNTIAGPLGKANVFPTMAVSMIAIGEQTGALDQMLTKIAEFYEDEVDATVGALSSILEPLMIVIVGLVVAAVMIPMYLPIFSIADTVG
jgi:type IV pilus assembly protein PilC